MKIVVIMGSPRKKDSYSVCKLLEKNIYKNSSFEFEYIFLQDYKIENCKGCELCFKKSETLCPLKDDLAEIKNKLLAADGIIFAAPVYAYQVPAPLKQIIDRFSYLFHRQELVKKPALSIVTTDGGGHKQVSQYLKMTLCGWGCDLIGQINVISPMFFENETWYNKKYHAKNLNQIEKIGLAFKKALERKELPNPSFYDIFLFNCLRSKTFTSMADYDYWNHKGWLTANYYYDVHLGLFKICFGKLLYHVIHYLGKKYQNN